MSDKRQQIYVVDDNPDFRSSLRFWLEGFGCEVRDWGDPREALQALSRVAVGATLPEASCLMLDVRMPELSGLDLHDALQQRGVTLPVIYMSGHADVPLAVAAMQKRGSVTLLEKPLDDEALSAALERAFSHAEVDTGWVPEAEGCREEFERRERQLSPRERQVLSWVVKGLMNKQIADEIALSLKSVELYRSRGMRKMKARSVSELTRMMVSRRA
ncbi:LuxR C-terminal-related transcriptional regulator [Paucibacter sp. APW11]|uniref:LuxR C-terminal-related transcriptional regulator n=1 Tax=Roseateles aquae TaxID=3077235 RepID=A0ABU3PEK5_9BURK|nr:response regulator [Paucibacter sp. APW11]MDT9000953.1 LuxR C-terminal-related transcriptional regulator [Paucibacter sp. APW11]